VQYLDELILEILLAQYLKTNILATNVYKWTDPPSVKYPDPRAWFVFQSNATDLFLYGGSGDVYTPAQIMNYTGVTEETLADVWNYNIQSNQWTYVEDMLTEMYGMNLL
jgi:hypothetical protein